MPQASPQGHVPGAVHVPGNERIAATADPGGRRGTGVGGEAASARPASISTGRSSSTPPAAARSPTPAAFALRYFGARRVATFHDGIEGWREAGEAIETTASPRPPVAVQLRLDPALVVDPRGAGASRRARRGAARRPHARRVRGHRRAGRPRRPHSGRDQHPVRGELARSGDRREARPRAGGRQHRHAAEAARRAARPLCIARSGQGDRGLLPVRRARHRDRVRAGRARLRQGAALQALLGRVRGCSPRRRW